MVMGSKKSKPKPNSKYGENTSGSSGSQTGESERKEFGRVHAGNDINSSGYETLFPSELVCPSVSATPHIHDIVF